MINVSSTPIHIAIAGRQRPARRLQGNEISAVQITANTKNVSLPLNRFRENMIPYPVMKTVSSAPRAREQSPKTGHLSYLSIEKGTRRKCGYFARIETVRKGPEALPQTGNEPRWRPIAAF